MLDEVGRLSSISRKLLLLSRADAGQLTLLRRSVNLSHALTDRVTEAQSFGLDVAISAEVEEGLVSFAVACGSGAPWTAMAATAPSGAQTAACAHVANSLKASTTGVATVDCDSTYAYVASNGLPTHAMMDGITATNLQVPVAQSFFGANAWKIPLQPAMAATTTTANDGPIGVAINGVPIFNPCKQGGCQNGDTPPTGLGPRWPRGPAR